MNGHGAASGRWGGILVLVVGLLATSASAQTSGDVGDPVLARVDGRIITAVDFQIEMDRRTAGDPDRYATLDERRALLDEMVRRELTVARALEAGYDRDPEFLAAMRRILIGRYTKDHLDPRLENLSVSNAEVRAAFESERDVYSRPERVKGAMIFLATGPRMSEEEVAGLEQRAEELRLEASEMTEIDHLGRLALENSDDRATRYTGGVLPWLTRGAETKWGSAVVDALFKIEAIGGVAPVVSTGDGFYVIRLVDREGRQQLPFEMYEAGIRKQLLHEKRNQEREAFYRDLEQSAEIEVDLTVLESVPGLRPGIDRATPPEPPAVPGD